MIAVDIERVRHPFSSERFDLVLAPGKKINRNALTLRLKKGGLLEAPHFSNIASGRHELFKRQKEGSHLRFIELFGR